MIKLWTYAGCMTMALLVGQVAHAAEALEKMKLCMGCHGMETSTDALIPNLAGQNPQYLFNQVKNFKEGSRNDMTMSAVVGIISEDDIKVIAAEYSKITPTKNTSADATLVTKGKVIFEGVCFACHGAKGLGNENIARLASQKPAYVVKQLQAFKSGDRKNDTMPDIAKTLSEEDMKAVAEFVSTL